MITNNNPNLPPHPIKKSDPKPSNQNNFLWTPYKFVLWNKKKKKKYLTPPQQQKKNCGPFRAIKRLKRSQEFVIAFQKKVWTANKKNYN